jgi:hypothetical protein
MRRSNIIAAVQGTPKTAEYDILPRFSNPNAETKPEYNRVPTALAQALPTGGWVVDWVGTTKQ